MRNPNHSTATKANTSSFAIPCASGESKNDTSGSIRPMSNQGRRPYFYSTLISATRELGRCGLFLLLVVIALMAPNSLHSQSAPTLSLASAQLTAVSGLIAPWGVAVDAKGDLFVTSGNQVLEIPANGGTQTTLGSGLNAPLAVAVDAAGNVFIVDNGNDRVVKVPADGRAQTTVGSGLNAPHSVAVDAAGDVFIADTLNSRVVEVPVGGGPQTTVASGLTLPLGVAVDRAGDVFIACVNQPASTAISEVVEIPANGGTPIVIGSGLNFPQGVVVDGAGDVFIADTDNNRVVEVPAAGGAQFTVASGLYQPHQLALDPTGNLVIADTFNNRVLEIEHGAVNAGSANVCPGGQTTPAPCSHTVALTYNVTSGGEVAAVNVLTQGVPKYDFTLTNTTCTGQLNAGTSCTVNVKLMPLASVRLRLRPRP
jgi:hypothetical protein